MRPFILVILFVGAVGLVASACGNSAAPTPDMLGAPDMSMAQGQADMAIPCVMNPMTNLEIINACTNAEFIDIMPHFPTLAPNGQLPPLP